MSEIPYLSNLGVPVLFQARTPTADGFPITFNPHTKAQWDAAVKELTPSKDAVQDWGLVIQYYIDLCSKHGQYPFSGPHTSSNDQIVAVLKEARHAVVKFINKSELIKMVSFRDTHRKVSMTATGFILQVQGQARLKDETFPQWLVQAPMPRFDIIRDADGKYIKHLGYNTAFFAYNEGANMTARWHVGYEIVVDKFPDIPNHPTPSKAELERFILDILWMPVLKQARPFGLSHMLM